MLGRSELAVLDSAMIKHADRGFDLDVFTVVVEIVEVDDFLDTSLNDGLRTFDAREVVDVDAGVLELTHVATEIEEGVELGMTDIGVLSV